NELVWPNGSIAQMFAADDPESLRGPQFDAAWCDELAKWPKPERAWDVLQLALRLGDNPQVTVTTTPRAIALLKRIAEDAGTVVS
ncbi:terminase family protein, partial [Mycobacterium tuberculosis]|nr:terminase family protein [Mycobacterium tuberculosis]